MIGSTPFPRGDSGAVNKSDDLDSDVVRIAQGTLALIVLILKVNPSPNPYRLMLFSIRNGHDLHGWV
jgi:hypothetical protein